MPATGWHLACPRPDLDSLRPPGHAHRPLPRPPGTSHGHL